VEAPVAEPAQPAAETLTPEQRQEKDRAKRIKGETSSDVVSGIDIHVILLLVCCLLNAIMGVE
jgi:hypothetical protein